jgi:hypothetical protein
MEKVFEGSNFSLIEIMFRHLPDGLRKLTENAGQYRWYCG